MAEEVRPSTVGQLLTVDECNRIWQELQTHKRLWIGLTDTHHYDNLTSHTPEVIKKMLDEVGIDPNIHKPYFFGPALYFTQQAGLDNYWKLCRKYNPILRQSFSWVYEKIKSILTQLYGFECNYNERDSSLPGFHIYGPGLDTPVYYDYFGFHQDKLEQIGQKVLATPVIIDSFVLPLIMPSRGGLEWVDENKNTQFFPYKVGEIHRWSSALIHRVAPFYLKKDEWRISIQIHVAHNKKQGLIYW